MTRVSRIIVSLLVAGMVGGLGTAYAEREGSGSQSEMQESSGSHTHDHAAAMPFHKGERVTLTGRIEGDWLLVTEGPHAGLKFRCLSKDSTWLDLKKQATAGQTYEIKGEALEEEGSNLIFVRSYRLVSSQTSPSTSPSYREGS